MIEMQMEHQIATLTINNPKANALSTDLIESLNDKLNEIEHSDTKVVLIRGEGKFFSAGADIKEFVERSKEQLTQQSARTHEVFNRIETFKVPVIALIKGAALGGGLELAMACHIRFATVDSQLGLPEFKLGLIPGYSGTRRLIQNIGQSKALQMILTAEIINGIAAEQLGLVSEVFSDESSMERHALELAKQMASFSKDSIYGVMAIQNVKHTEQNDALEAELFGQIFETENAKEGISAFIEKRNAEFK